MNDLLLFLHLVGLVMGAGPGIASMTVMRTAATLPPADGAVLRRLPPIFAMISATGLVVLWLTGLILVWSKYGGLGAMPGSFWIKMAFVLILTASLGLIHMKMKEARMGNAGAAALIPKLGMTNGVSSLLAVLFAVFAFH